MGDDFTEDCGRMKTAQPQGRGPMEVAPWVWLWSHTLFQEENPRGILVGRGQSRSSLLSGRECQGPPLLRS